MKIVIIYDSKGGNTRKMAEAIAEGASSVEGVEVEVKRIGEAFPLSLLRDADGVVFGSPVIYADVTNEMRDFLEHIQRYVDAGKMSMDGRRAAIFGSYGYDGAWIMEERLKDMVEGLGYEVQDEVCVQVDSDIKINTNETVKRCRDFGREFAESL